MKQNAVSMEDLNNYDFSCKIILCGDVSVGKTSIVSKYVFGLFPKEAIPTIGSDLKTKIIQIKNGMKIKAQIWDTAGQEKYKAMTAQYEYYIYCSHYRKALGAILVYDITRRSSFENIKKWLKELRTNSESNCYVILVGNKADIVEKDPNKRQVLYEEAKYFADSENIIFKESSALINLNVSSIFEELIEKIVADKNFRTELDKPLKLEKKVNNDFDKKKYGCC